MRFNKTHCPECGGIAKGALERVPGLALLTFDEDGTAEYTGETAMDWDGQDPILDDDGFVTLECYAGHRWQTRQDSEEPDEALYTVHYRIVSGIDNKTVIEHAMTVLAGSRTDATAKVEKMVIENEPMFDPRIDARIVVDEVELEGSSDG